MDMRWRDSENEEPHRGKMSTSHSVRQPWRSNRRSMAVLARIVVDSSQRRSGCSCRPCASVCACGGGNQVWRSAAKAGGGQQPAEARVLLLPLCLVVRLRGGECVREPDGNMRQQGRHMCASIRWQHAAWVSSGARLCQRGPALYSQPPPTSRALQQTTTSATSETHQQQGAQATAAGGSQRARSPHPQRVASGLAADKRLWHSGALALRHPHPRAGLRHLCRQVLGQRVGAAVCAGRNGGGWGAGGGGNADGGG